MPKKRAIFFDVGNTLLFPNWAKLLAPLALRGIQFTSEQLAAIERKTKQEFDRVMVACGHADRSFWEMYYAHLLRSVGVDDAVLHLHLTAATRVSSNWNQIRPGTREALRRIGQHYPIGVISNADGRVADVLTSCGIGDCFLIVIDSGVVGQEKPHSAIFEAAAREINAATKDCLYVGDVYSVDYQGARRAGMQAMLMDIAGTYRDTGLARVENLGELEEHLGVSRGAG